MFFIDLYIYIFIILLIPFSPISSARAVLYFNMEAWCFNLHPSSFPVIQMQIFQKLIVSTKKNTNCLYYSIAK